MLIDNQLLDRVTEEAKASPRLRMNYNFHTSLDAKAQRLLNALEPGTIVPIHRHKTNGETNILLRGKLRMLIYTVPVMLIAITVHEFAHGWVSYKLGDPTPKYEGRLSLNPLRHLDLIGTLCLLFFHMGWAKPVRINTAYYRNKRQGIIWVSLAGPVANFLTAFLSLLICGALMRFGNSGNSAVSIGIMLCYYSAVLNIGLGVFNLIPIPPLDGSNVVEQMYPRVFYFYQRIRPYCTLILLILLVTGVLSRPLSVANNGIFAAMWNIVSTIFSLGTGGSSGGGISSGGGYI